MDERYNLILVKGKNKTREVQSCELDQKNGKYRVKFCNGGIYNYNCDNVIWLTNPEILDPKFYRISSKWSTLKDIQSISVFKGKEEYWHIVFCNGSSKTYNRNNLKAEKSCMNESTLGHRLEYLNKLAELNTLQIDGRQLLKDYYKDLDFVDVNSALAVYLDPEKHKAQKLELDFLIFPFGGNASQFRAVENAFSNQISVIQGPPGTGKTQTILNIIANILIRNMTVQVVSSNNSAVINVHEKLKSDKYKLGFIAALLGKQENRDKFFQEQKGEYPDLLEYKKSPVELRRMQENITLLSQEIKDCFSKQTRLSEARQELAAVELEFCHFKQFIENTVSTSINDKMWKWMPSHRIMGILQEYETFMERSGRIPLWLKLKNAILYGILDWQLYEYDFYVVIANLQNLYYVTKLSELRSEISEIKKFLTSVNAEKKMQQLTDLSMSYLRAILFDRYKGKTSRVLFDENHSDPSRFLQEYPVILSSTFSSSKTLKDVTYDYVIMDEASQVDIATGSLALSCARNAVIVGDLKQLSNIVKKNEKKKYDSVFRSYNVPPGYSNSEYSLLKSICTVINGVPQTLLREHYRCHPKIIGFCNQKFYNGELIIMTEDHGESDAITLFRTSVGNHQRENVNQRQVDVIEKEILPKLNDIKSGDIGIITPYVAQVEAIKTVSKDIYVNTIHKFQGQEKDVIILSMVDDLIRNFTDRPDLLNVALSRAKNNLYIVMSGNEQPKDSNIQDLIDYIQYNNLGVIESELYSIFDLLYQQHTKARLEYLAKYKRISQFDSENLMYATLVDILREFPNLPLQIICHQKLRFMIKNVDKLTEEERKYVSNMNTHIDFLIYNRVTKKPVLAIEVDGFSFHKDGTKQAERDKLKDSILKKYGIPLRRLRTNGSREVEIIKTFLQSIH